MSMTKGLTRLWSAALAAGLVAGAGTSVEAAAILKYQTATAINLDKGITGPNLISFTPASSAGVDLASGSVNAGLGTFVVAPPAAGSQTVYDNVPFAITFLPQSLDDQPITSVSQVITGVLNGVVDSPYHSTVTATFNEPEGKINLDGSRTIALSFPKGDKLLVPSQSNGGVTTAEAQITSTVAPIPEPSMIALTLTALGGLALRRRLSRRRAPQTA